VFFDANARGPTQSPASINFQMVDNYLEYAVNHRVSAFVDIPIRWVHFGPDVEDPDERIPGTNQFFNEPNFGRSESVSSNTGGLSDIQAGFKAALVANPAQYLTFQFRTYIPTGDVGQGLGTGHVSLEPGLLLYQRLADRLFLQGQSTLWVPVRGGLAAGDIFTYGLGVGYNVFQRGNFWVTPITELLGWTVLSGYESVFNGNFSPTVPLANGNLTLPTTHGVVPARGDTIVNLKLGGRIYFGSANSVYVGWGHALTGDRWYKDIFRVEYRYAF
jgi:hypothetical protein